MIDVVDGESRLGNRRTGDPPVSERARVANEAGAEILVAMHLNAHRDPAAEGASSYFYGREGWSSTRKGV